MQHRVWNIEAAPSSSARVSQSGFRRCAPAKTSAPPATPASWSAAEICLRVAAVAEARYRQGSAIGKTA